ncbi:MAG: hypothetical protein K2X39_05720, partial [Silvanigrellaceae bacterium]|nr:hypothetical protein [Silvanigrellaceae bacterium]
HTTDPSEVAKLVHSHYQLKAKPTTHSIISAKVYVTANNQPAIQKQLDNLNNEKYFLELFKVTPAKIDAKDETGFDYKANIAQQGQTSFLKKVLIEEEKIRKAPVDNEAQYLHLAREIEQEHKKNTIFFKSRSYLEMLDQVKTLQKELNRFFVFGRTKKQEKLKFLSEALALASAGKSSNVEENIRNAVFTCYSRWQMQGKRLDHVFAGGDSRTAALLRNALPSPDSTQKIMTEILAKDEVPYTVIRELIVDMRKASLSWWTSDKQRSVIQAKIDFLTQLVDKATELAGQNAILGKKEGVLKEALHEVSKTLTPETFKVIIQGAKSRTHAFLRNYDFHCPEAEKVTEKFKAQRESRIAPQLDELAQNISLLVND